MIPPPPPPNPRTIPPHLAPPFPMAVQVLPNATGANVAGYNIYTPQQYNQMRHAGNMMTIPSHHQEIHQGSIHLVIVWQHKWLVCIVWAEHIVMRE
jgi:hypothetical protein